MSQWIADYLMLTPFTSRSAGTAEWCKASRGGLTWFIKRFLSPTNPDRDSRLPEKVLAIQRANFARALEMHSQRYATLRSINTEGVMAVPEQVFEYSLHICTVTEFIEFSLTAQEKAALPAELKLRLMLSLAQALSAMDQAGLVHSDIKPDNVLITKLAGGNCACRLIDFDSCFEAAHPPAADEEVHGDFACMAPEMLRLSTGEPVVLTGKIDTFAAGLVMHELWSGALPGTDRGTAAEALLRGGEIHYAEDLPEELRSLLESMLSPEPEARPAWDAVIRTLEALRTGKTDTAPQEKPPVETPAPAEAPRISLEKPLPAEEPAPELGTEPAPPKQESTPVLQPAPTPRPEPMPNRSQPAPPKPVPAPAPQPKTVPQGPGFPKTAPNPAPIPAPRPQVMPQQPAPMPRQQIVPQQPAPVPRQQTVPQQPAPIPRQQPAPIPRQQPTPPKPAPEKSGMKTGKSRKGLVAVASVVTLLLAALLIWMLTGK